MNPYITVDSVVSRVKSRFQIEIDPYEATLNCLEAMRQMQIYANTDVYFIADVKNHRVTVDEDVQKILSVTRFSQPVSLPRIIRQNMTYPTQYFFRIEAIEEEPEIRDFIQNVIPHIKGPYIDFNFKCPVIHLNEDKIQVLIHGKGFEKDKTTGFIKIPESAYEGCVHWCAFVYMQPLYLLGRVPDYVMQRVENWLDQNLEFSRTRHIYKSLSQNDINDIQDIHSSHDRKSPNIDA